MSDPFGRGDRIYVAGHRGLVGSAIVRRLRAEGYSNLVLRTHAELDLVDTRAVDAFFAAERPAHVFLAAARVGGVHANNTLPAEFIHQNLMIQSNVLEAAHRTGVRKLLFLGSSCIYPRLAPQPMREDYMLTGPLEPTNEAYAIAKIAGIKACAAYNRQYGTNFLAVMPANMYGPGDNYDLAGSHFVPALMRKMHEAKRRGAQEVVIWGSGTPRRELLFSDDLADAVVFLMQRHDAAALGEFVNIGVGTDATIMDIAREIATVVGYTGRFSFDASKPDGMPRKVLDVSRMRALGWTAPTPLRAGLEKAYEDFLARYGEMGGA